MSAPKPPRALLPTVDPRTWKPDQRLLDKALGKKPDEKRDGRKSN